MNLVRDRRERLRTFNPELAARLDRYDVIEATARIALALSIFALSLSAFTLLLALKWA